MRAPWFVSCCVRLWVVAASLVCLWLSPRALGAPAAAAPDELPTTVTCEAGFEQSFGDRTAPYYTIGIAAGPGASKRSALFTLRKNDGARPYYGAVVTERRVSGAFHRRGARLSFVARGFMLLVSGEGATRAAELRIAGKKMPARCAIDGTLEPAPAVQLLRSTAFGELRSAAREALADDYQLRYGPITTVASGDRLKVEVALRKLRSHVCSSLPTVRRLPFATVLATLSRSKDPTLAGGTRWDVEHIELVITDPSPPPTDTPSADDVAVALRDHYGGARTFEARFRVLAARRGVFSVERTTGLLRADTVRGVSVRADAYRQLELQGQVVRYLPAARPNGTVLMHAYRLALPFLAADLRENFDLTRSRSDERCTPDYVLVATPKRKDTPVERISLSIDRVSLTLRGVAVRTSDLDYSIDFEHQKVGLPLPGGEFELATPPGYQLDATIR